MFLIHYDSHFRLKQYEVRIKGLASVHQSIIEGPTYGLYYVQDNPPGYWPLELYGISGAGRLQVPCKSEEAEKKTIKIVLLLDLDPTFFTYVLNWCTISFTSSS